MKTKIKYLIALVFVPLLLIAQTRTDFSGLKFCIDPGHGGNNPANDRLVIPDPGIEFWESESNFQKALLLDTLLKQKNAWVILTRYTNYYPDDNLEPSLAARAAIANQNNVHFFHSIHSNATGGTNTGTNYTLMLFRGYDNQPVFPEAKTMSSYTGPQIRSHLRTTTSYVRGDWSFYGNTSGLGVLRPLQMPGQLSEGSFHDYFPETRRLMNQAYRKMEAFAIMKSFMQFYNVPADTFAIIAGIQTDADSLKPKNGTRVRLLPENRIYQGDFYNNGFYMFDFVPPTPHQIKFETTGYVPDSVNLNVSVNGLHFVDRNLIFNVPPVIIATQPINNDTSFRVTNYIGIRFSRAMDTASVRQAFSITPQASGSISWVSGNSLFFFFPSPQLEYDTWYTVKIDSTARSIGGIKIDGNGDGTPGDPFVLRFKTQAAPTHVESNTELPRSIVLHQNYPNPFNPETIISFELPEQTFATLKIYDLHGSEIKTLIKDVLPSGYHSIKFDASNLSSGVYVYKLITSNKIVSKKMILVK
ncbi:MAG: N-acetylmuramoyl-L-alanine amidase [Ignavibacteria bacterium]|nr:N-acetylmuramoyl-L-alanine amidase [Ignavibacteria bacterium]